MFFTECPVGCDSKLAESDIVIPECTLLMCSSCGQLLGNADEKLYHDSMKRFDDVAQVDSNPRVHIRRFSRLRHYCPLPPEDTKVLDVGSSFGMFLKVLASHGYGATGVDTSESAVKACRQEGLDAHHGLLEDMNYPDGSFDVITLYEVIEHLSSPRPLLDECFRVLKYGGMMFISTGNTDSWTVKFLKGKWDYFSMTDGGQGHISFYNPESISRVAGASGFRLIATESRRVKVASRKHDTRARQLVGKVAQELLSGPAKLFNKGHDMLAVFGKQ